MPFFSILVPVCNQEKKMDVCLASLKNQTFTDFEVIFVDDGSTDGSLNILKEFVKNDSRARIIEHGVNKSLLYARWTAMGDIKGKYVIFLDSDDALTCDACEKLHNYFVNNDVDAVRFGFKYKNANRDIVPQEVPDELEAYFSGKIPPAIWKNAYTAETIKKAHDTMEPFYCNMAEDSFYVSVFFTNAKKVGVLSDIIYIYTDDNGMSSERNNLTCEKFKRALSDLENSGKKFVSYIEKYNKKYLELAKKQSLRIKRFLVLQYVLWEEDWHKIYDILTVINVKEHEDAFNYCCNNIFEMKVLKARGENVKINYDLDLK